MNLNFIDINFIKHLKKQRYHLEGLDCRIFNMEPEALTEIGSMNLRKLTFLAYNYMKLTPKIAEDFFKTAYLPSLQSLYLYNILNGGQILKYILEANLSSLVYLDISSDIY